MYGSSFFHILELVLKLVRFPIITHLVVFWDGSSALISTTKLLRFARQDTVKFLKIPDWPVRKKKHRCLTHKKTK